MHKKQKHFGQTFLGQKLEHNKEAACLRKIKKDMNGRNKKVQVQMSQEKLKKALKKIQN